MGRKKSIQALRNDETNFLVTVSFSRILYRPVWISIAVYSVFWFIFMIYIGVENFILGEMPNMEHTCVKQLSNYV